MRMCLSDFHGGRQGQNRLAAHLSDKLLATPLGRSHTRKHTLFTRARAQRLASLPPESWSQNRLLATPSNLPVTRQCATREVRTDPQRLNL